MKDKSQKNDGLAILDEAMQNPGVKEVMEVFSNWKVLDCYFRDYRSRLEYKSIVNVSNSSVE